MLLGALIERECKSGTIFCVELAFLDIFHNTDDFHGNGFGRHGAELFADGIFAGEILSFKGLIDDGFVRLAGVFIVDERTAGFDEGATAH